ncbi:hypothetical protein AZE42_02300 [Rhizopogon vesiculosus]|uniref:Uncharacterized protein n=1 Tax=Rhizopogon vesiculosus TaxID=180088 RepID=A0A1J8QIM6_9AGAM|nr:hypothetical protein AZE42_02300 [Rhizopogon vesiculosus]
MAFHDADKKYYAIEALTWHATGMAERGILCELPSIELTTVITPPASDFTSMQFTVIHTSDETTLPGLRAPELILKSPRVANEFNANVSIFDISFAISLRNYEVMQQEDVLAIAAC